MLLLKCGMWAISKGFEGFKHSEFHTNESEHGREEIRHYLMLSDIEEKIDPDKKWVNLQSVGMVEYIRKVNGKTKVETRYYISSLINDAKIHQRVSSQSLGYRELITLERQRVAGVPPVVATAVFRCSF